MKNHAAFKIFSVIISFLGIILLTTNLTQGQQKAQKWEEKNVKHEPAKIENAIVIVGEPVVTVQWPNSLRLVNIPPNITQLNPGQCIRVGIGATGDGRDEFIQSAHIAFKVTYAGSTQAFPSAPIAEWKQIKPEGGDFVTQVLDSANIENPMLTMYSLAVSADHWCTPADAKDGVATIEAEADSSKGHIKLPTATVKIESYDTGAKNSIKDLNELGEFSMNYYRQPNPARLAPALEAFVREYSQAAKDTSKPQPAAGSDRDFLAFLIAALKVDPLAAQDFKAHIATKDKAIYYTGLAVLKYAGHDIEKNLDALSADDRAHFAALPPFDNPYDMTPDSMLYTRFDEMWAIFGTTGEIKPIKTIVSALAWRADYEAFENARKDPNHKFTLTPDVARALGYRVAGWSIGSFQRNNTLAADYIDAMLQSSDTPAAVKEELKHLQTNDAFKQPK